jgi:hypothetical protein
MPCSLRPSFLDPSTLTPTILVLPLPSELRTTFTLHALRQQAPALTSLFRWGQGDTLHECP